MLYNAVGSEIGDILKFCLVPEAVERAAASLCFFDLVCCVFLDELFDGDESSAYSYLYLVALLDVDVHTTVTKLVDAT